ncbi:hypothetical protein [Cyclobacterium plantarum]|uniref:Outer membrane protein beta-barrel domain-containing protein n=1 Tax=Cyclobacterium plantarum TaxID=2716263 RepID=A0ABX0HAR9_9BACT|nr:hypothetical protein [Cyclobacterium plantarum]NHE58995.1 hypothetical protein [Cyclobacterium plantarum]
MNRLKIKIAFALACMIGYFANGTVLLAQSVKENTFYTVAVDPTFGGNSNFVSVPPVSLYMEKGIADFLSVGLAVGADMRKWVSTENTLALGLTGRFVGYAFQAVEKFSGDEVTVAGLEPYFGFTYGRYWPWAFEENGSLLSFSGFGVVLGTRWYPGDSRNFGLMLEYSSRGNTGMGSGINVGVTFGR